MARGKSRRDPLRSVAVFFTVALHVGVFGGLWLTRALANRRPVARDEAFVEAQLVRFGKPRDLSFLPHKEGRVKEKPADIKIAKDANAPVKQDKPEEKKDVDPLKKTHAELFKQLQNDQEGVEVTQTGSLTGSRAGTATEAKGDPYILALVDKIGSAWTVPTTIRESELATLTADVCLTISESGALVSYKVDRGSGNSQFDSSLEATLSTLKTLPPPPNRDIQTPKGPRNLLSLAKRGGLCATVSPPGK